MFAALSCHMKYCNFFHSSDIRHHCSNVLGSCLKVAEALLEKETLTYKDMEQLIGPPTFGKSLRFDWRTFSKTAAPSSESPVTS